MGRPVPDHRGRHAFFTVLRPAEIKRYPSGSSNRLWLCLCDCGRYFEFTGSQIKRNKSCGCKKSELARLQMTTHGKDGTRVLATFHAIHRRCYKPKDKDYPNYGGRGIKVCKRWQKFENFHADMGDPPEEKSIERKNNDANYSPSNCFWASRKEQNRNTRRNRFLTLGKKTQCLSAWAEELGIPYYTIINRLRRYPDWSTAQVLTP